jgi:spore maturation protein CgeB
MAYKILIAGETTNHCLEMSYYEAFTALGHDVKLYNTKEAIQKYVKPGKWAYSLHQFFPVEAWIRKANKDFCTVALSFKPDILMLFTGAEILPGSFAFLKSILPVRIVWYWADPLPNLTRYIQSSLPLADLIFSYSKSSLRPFEAMGAIRTGWIPFAGDLSAHFVQATEKTEYTWDISFIGSWRPERERALQIIHQNFPTLRIRISGPYWRRCTYKPLKKIASGKPFYGKDFSEIVSRSFLSLNVIDETNYPAVNMRYFEILAAGGAEICSAAPEMEDLFKDRQQILYFSGKEQLISQIQYAFANKEKIEKMRLAAQELLMRENLYKHRALAILNML